MFSVLVLIVLFLFAMTAFYLLLGFMGLFGTAGKLALRVNSLFQEEENKTNTNTEEIK